MLAFFIFKLTLSFGLRTIKINSDGTPSNFPEDNVNQTIIVNEHRELGECACDVTNQCDPYCCCDRDCPLLIKKDFKKAEKCLPNLSNFNVSEKKALRKCSDPRIEGDGSLLDWIQRTMLCISRDNNPSVGKFFEIKTRSNSDTKFVDTQSSLSNSFQPAHETEEILRPLISIINVNNIRNEETDESLPFYLSKLCNFSYEYNATYPCPGEYYFNGSFCINEFNDSITYPDMCLDGYEYFNGTHCVNESGDTSDEAINHAYAYLCDGFIFNGTHCEIEGEPAGPKICPEGYYYSREKNRCIDQSESSDYIDLTMHPYCSDDECYLNQNLDEITTLYQENQDDISYTCKKGAINITEYHNTRISFNITNIHCINSTSCTAKFENEIISSDETTKSEGTIESLSLEDINKSSNTTISIKLHWPTREGAKPQPRGYYFSEELKDGEDNIIEIEAPSQSDSCDNHKTPLRFGMNVDFTCMTSLKIADCNLTTNETIFNEKCNFSKYTPNIPSIRQVPFPSDGDNSVIDFPAEEFILRYNEAIAIAFANSSIEVTPGEFKVDSLFVTEFSRSINIFYKTVGYEKKSYSHNHECECRL